MDDRNDWHDITYIIDVVKWKVIFNSRKFKKKRRRKTYWCCVPLSEMGGIWLAWSKIVVGLGLIVIDDCDDGNATASQ